MDTYTHQMEMLLVMNCQFCSRNWVKRTETEADKKFNSKEKLIDACWNGLVPEMLPECFYPINKSLRLLEINESNAFIDLWFCDRLGKCEDEFSVNPYLFMEVQHYN